MNQKKIGVILSYAQIFITLLVNLLYVPIMLRLLGQSEYGVYSLSSSVINYFSLLYVGMTSTYLRYCTVYHKDAGSVDIARLNGLFLLLFTGLGGGALVFGVWVSMHLEAFLGGGLTDGEYGLARILFILMSFNMALLMPKTVFATILISHERFVFVKSLDIVCAGVVPLASLPLLFMGYGSIGMACVTLSVTALTLLAGMSYCIWSLNTQFFFRQLPFFLLPGMFTFSFFIFLQGIMDQLNWQLGKVILANFSDSAAIAVYSIALQVALLFINFASAFSGVFVPQIYQIVRLGTTNQLTQLWIRVGRYQFFVVYFIWISFLFFGKSFIVLWAGNGYEDAYVVAILLMTPMVLHLCQVMAIEILRAYDKHRMWTIVHFVFAIIGFLVCIPLTKAYGILGVSIGTFVSMFLVTNVYDNWYYAREVHLGVRAFFCEMRKLLPAGMAVAVLAAGMTMCFSLNDWKTFSIAGIVFALMYACIMYICGMNTEEKEIVRKGGQRIMCMVRKYHEI